MLASIKDIIINLAAAGIGAAAVFAWQTASSWWRYRGQRKFWKPFVSGQCLCVTGRISPLILSKDLPSSVVDPSGTGIDISNILPSLQSHLGEQELSGLVGGGDHDAIVQVQAGLTRIGLKSPILELSGVASRGKTRENLIVVGGPDVNWLTRDLTERLKLTFVITQNKQGRNIVRDRSHNQDYEPSHDLDSGRIRDYGILVRAANPHDHRKTVLIFAGAHGYGSLASAVVAFQEEDIRHAPTSTPAVGFECLVYHEQEGAEESANAKSSIVIKRPLF